MRVAVDARHLGRGRGIARYLESMLKGLANQPGDTEWLAVVPAGAADRLPAGIEAVLAPRPARLANASSAVVGLPRLDRAAGGADAVWIPAPAPVAWSAAVPSVLTVHDVSWEERPSDFTPYERSWHAIARPRRLAARASAVACVSRATRDAMLASGWPVDPTDIVVIPEAPLAAPDASVPPPPADGRYLLYVGALEPRKGIDILCGALRRARQRGLELPLVVVGEGRERRRLEGLEGVRFRTVPSDSELADIYSEATALIQPSWLEGFGLPPVEAAAFGVPTVASDLPVFRENLPDAFVAVPPGDVSALGEAIFSIATDTAQRNRVGQSAQAAVTGLSWNRSAGQLLELITRLARPEPA